MTSDHNFEAGFTDWRQDKHNISIASCHYYIRLIFMQKGQTREIF